MIEETIRHKERVYLAGHGLVVTDMMHAIAAAVALLDHVQDRLLDIPEHELSDQTPRLFAEFDQACADVTAALLIRRGLRSGSSRRGLLITFTCWGRCWSAGPKLRGKKPNGRR
ncbi:hypothetical protein [Gemmobacter sp. 24YEA27]|uniref:hypothetical protein n=1 Tax=Gemmobacter sp. 24YEA27 TaxID=3040672 RepID=UPI0024B3B718|nr:hypothetical protein [Gemmobacter sp. 24YEA27]